LFLARLFTMSEKLESTHQQPTPGQLGSADPDHTHLHQDGEAREKDLEQSGGAISSPSPSALDAESDKPDIIPNGGYGWVNVGCVVAQNSVSWGESLS
jgi:hypothetical protein